MMRRRRPVQTLQFHFLIFTVVKSMLTLFRHRHELLRRLTFTVYWASRHNSWAVIYLRENVLGEGCLVRTSIAALYSTQSLLRRSQIDFFDVI